MPTEFYTVEELAALLKVKEQTVRQWIREGKIESYKFGRAHRVTREGIERFMANHKYVPNEDQDVSEVQ